MAIGDQIDVQNRIHGITGKRMLNQHQGKQPLQPLPINHRVTNKQDGVVPILVEDGEQILVVMVGFLMIVEKQERIIGVQEADGDHSDHLDCPSYISSALYSCIISRCSHMHPLQSSLQYKKVYPVFGITRTRHYRLSKYKFLCNVIFSNLKIASLLNHQLV